MTFEALDRVDKRGNETFVSMALYHRFRWYATLENKTPAEFRQSCVLLTDRIEIHQLQPLAWPSNLFYFMLSGCDWWISIRSVNNTQDWRKFWKRFYACFVFQSRESTKTVVSLIIRKHFSLEIDSVAQFLSFSLCICKTCDRFFASTFARTTWRTHITTWLKGKEAWKGFVRAPILHMATILLRKNNILQGQILVAHTIISSHMTTWSPPSWVRHLGYH